MNSAHAEEKLILNPGKPRIHRSHKIQPRGKGELKAVLPIYTQICEEKRQSLEDLGPTRGHPGVFSIGRALGWGYPEEEKQRLEHELDLLQGRERSILPRDKQLAEFPESPLGEEGKGEMRMLKY